MDMSNIVGPSAVFINKLNYKKIVIINTINLKNGVVGLVFFTNLKTVSNNGFREFIVPSFNSV